MPRIRRCAYLGEEGIDLPDELLEDVGGGLDYAINGHNGPIFNLSGFDKKPINALGVKGTGTTSNTFGANGTGTESNTFGANGTGTTANTFGANGGNGSSANQ